VTDPEEFLALGKRYEISDIVHLVGSIPADDPVSFFRTDPTGLLNALDAVRTWGVRRFAVASSTGNHIGRAEIPSTEDLPLPAADYPHLSIAFRKADEPIITHAVQGTDGQPVLLRIGSTWGPLMDPETAFSPKPPYISAVLRGETPPAVPAAGDSCYAPDAAARSPC
jgi:nucleoside-diphosphate-sugar epimerase